MNPINPMHMQRAEAIRRDFVSDHPLPAFTVIPDFLRRELIEEALAGCKKAPFENYCTYSMSADGNLTSEFCEADETAYFLTVHQRSRTPVPEIARLKNAMGSPAAIEALNLFTGMQITEIYETDVLTCWNPGSFLGVHTDDAPSSPMRLAVSLSLTDGWDPRYGGATLYAWRQLDRCVRFQPILNAAILFAPFGGSEHWVERISDDAPALTRFTWTAFFM